MSNRPLITAGDLDDADELAARLVGSDKTTENKQRPAEDVKPTEAAPLPKPPVEGITPEAWAKLTPDEQWHRILQQCNLSLEDARAIQLAIIRKGYYAKSYKLWGGLVTVTFRTAGPDHRRRVLRAIEQLPSQVMNDTVDIVQNQNDLAGSLAAFDNGEENITFEFPPRGPDPKVVDDLHAKRLAFVGTIPEEVLPHVQRVFAHFKTISHAALSNGAVGSF
jgi:hypothetical protein